MPPRVDPRDPRSKINNTGSSSPSVDPRIADPRVQARLDTGPSNSPPLNDSRRDPRRHKKLADEPDAGPMEPAEPLVSLKPLDDPVYINCCEDDGYYSDLIKIDYERKGQELPKYVDVNDEHWRKDPRIQKFTNTYIPFKRARRSSSSGDEGGSKRPMPILAWDPRPSSPPAATWKPQPAQSAESTTTVEAYVPGQGLRKVESAPPSTSILEKEKESSSSSISISNDFSYTPRRPHTLVETVTQKPTPDKPFDEIVDKISLSPDDKVNLPTDPAHNKLMAPPPLPDMSQLTDVTKPPELPALLATPPDDMLRPFTASATSSSMFMRQNSEPAPDTGNKPLLSHRFDPRFKKKSKSGSSKTKDRTSSASEKSDTSPNRDSIDSDKSTDQAVPPLPSLTPGIGFNFYSTVEEDASSVKDTPTILDQVDTEETSMKDLFKQCDPTASPFL